MWHQWLLEFPINGAMILKSVANYVAIYEEQLNCNRLQIKSYHGNPLWHVFGWIRTGYIPCHRVGLSKYINILRSLQNRLGRFRTLKCFEMCNISIFLKFTYTSYSRWVAFEYYTGCMYILTYYSETTWAVGIAQLTHHEVQGGSKNPETEGRGIFAPTADRVVS